MSNIPGRSDGEANFATTAQSPWCQRVIKVSRWVISPPRHFANISPVRRQRHSTDNPDSSKPRAKCAHAQADARRRWQTVVDSFHASRPSLGKCGMARNPRLRRDIARHPATARRILEGWNVPGDGETSISRSSATVASHFLEFGELMAATRSPAESAADNSARNTRHDGKPCATTKISPMFCLEYQACGGRTKYMPSRCLRTVHLATRSYH